MDWRCEKCGRTYSGEDVEKIERPLLVGTQADWKNQKIEEWLLHIDHDPDLDVRGLFERQKKFWEIRQSGMPPKPQVILVGCKDVPGSQCDGRSLISTQILF